MFSQKLRVTVTEKKILRPLTTVERESRKHKARDRKSSKMSKLSVVVELIFQDKISIIKTYKSCCFAAVSVG